MKAYLITDPEKLKDVVPLMKWQKERDKVASFARVWSATKRKEPEKAKELFARIEIGRSAQVFKRIGTSITLMGTMSLPAAKQFVAGLEEVK